MIAQPSRLSEYQVPSDPKLVVADMDGTLLDENGRIPEELWSLLDIMKQRGISFVPASGRQYFTLESMFHRASEGMPFICENGTFVVRDGQEVSSCSIPREGVETTIGLLADGARRGRKVGAVIAGKKRGYFELVDPEFQLEVDKYYRRSSLVTDILDYDDDVNKVAIYDFGDAETGVFQELNGHLDDYSIVVSAKHWVDVMHPEANKGTAVRALQAELGVSPEETVAFGDYLNDLEMLQASGMSFAMANANPGIIEVSRFIAPSNAEHGVITVLKNLLGL